MSYKALYRTYRPSTFEEVAGQQHIVRTLKNALKENKIAHAYLFCGPRGTGKTTMARLFAKALNCSEGFGLQCNECENCVAISEGRHPDVIELDAASNRGIDDIRDLISKVKYSPIMGRYKVYIIDEVHMMTTEAFNALLKTLEEPPERVVFILATTEPYKLMPTILSRCQRYDFTKVSDGDIYNRLVDICQAENIEVEDEALVTIVSLCDGGVRDALSMLDQVIAYCGNNITLKACEELYGLSSVSEKISLLKAIDKGDILTITSKTNELTKQGVDIKRLTSDLLEILKDLLIYQTTSDEKLMKQVKLSDIEGLNISTAKINKMIDILLDALTSYRMVNNIKSLFEITLLKMASIGVQQTVVEVPQVEVQPTIQPAIQQVQVETPVVQPTPVPVVPQNPVQPAMQVQQPVEQSVPEVEPVPTVDVTTQGGFARVNYTNVEPFEEEGHPITYTKEDVINIMVQASKDAKLKLIDSWKQLDGLFNNNRIGRYAQTLKSAMPRIVSQDAIVLESQFKNVTNRINTKENQNGFSKIIEGLNGNSCIVICMSQQEYVECVQKFTNLQQAGKLPSPEPVKIDITIE